MLDVLSKGLSSGDFPNPERVGCPGTAILEGIASHRIPLAEAEKWLDHLGSCSPCFQEFTSIRNQRRNQRLLKGGGLALLAISLVLWFTVRTHQPGTETAVLDLRGYSRQRGEQNLPQQPPLQLQRNAKHLVIDLPIGSKEGGYDFALMDERGQELLRGSGTAQLEDQTVVFRGDINVASVPPGSYFFGLRQNATEWSRFPIKVK